MTADERAEVERLVSGRGAGPYRWVVLGVGALGAGAFAALRMGLPSLGPAIRDVFGLTLGQVGLAFTALAVGTMVTLLAWGMLTDRIGERPVMVAGLAGTAAALVGAGLATGFSGLLLALFAAGAMGASATGASGRAIMGWFGWRERGTALGIRQMALPLGGGIGSLALPVLAAGAGGLQVAFFALAGVMLGAAAACLVLLREAPERPQVLPPAPPATPPMRDRRLWRLGAASALLVIAQSAMLGFLVLFLHDERGVPAATAALVLAAVLLIGAAGRVRAGRVSDREARRIAPMRRRALAGAGLLVAVAALTTAPALVLVPLLLAAGVATMTWNGLAFTAAAEISGKARAGTAMSMQNTIVAVGGAASPAVFGAVVEALGWAPAYLALAAGPLAAWLVLAPLVGDEDERVARRTARLRRSASLSRNPEPAT